MVLLFNWLALKRRCLLDFATVYEAWIKVGEHVVLTEIQVIQ